MKLKRINLKNQITDGIDAYKQHIRRNLIILAVMIMVTFVLMIISVNAGSAKLDVITVLKAFFGVGERKAVLIVQNIRLPRVVAAIVAGAGLALSGCVMQNVLKNPMASPSTLGVSNAAVFGANFAIIVLGAGAFHSTDGKTLVIDNPYLVTITAFVCAIAAVLIILALSGRRGFAPETVVLAGVALGSIFSAATTIVQYFALDNQVSSAVFWTFGDLGRASWRDDIIMSVICGVALVYFMFNRWSYNALANGEDVAKSLGVRTEMTRFWSLLLASMITAVCVSFLGIIGFIGLIAPQAMKRIVGGDYRFLLPTSALAGASLLLFADIIARVVINGVTLPVGAITALMGGPMFLWMLLSKRSKRI